jgi:sugar lactone lactonase YvrE
MDARVQRRRLGGVGIAAAAVLAGACSGLRSCAPPPPRPDGAFLYAVHDAPGARIPAIDPRITSWRIDEATGRLTPLGEPAGPGPGAAFHLLADPSGRFFALTGGVLDFLRCDASGAIVPDRRANDALDGAFDPRGRFFFRASGTGLFVHPLRRGGVDVTSTLHDEKGVMATALAATPDGRRLFAAATRLHVYDVGDDGRLSPAAGSPHDISFRPIDLRPHPAGRLLVALAEVAGRRRVVVLNVAADGGLTHVAGSPFDAGHDVRSMAVSRDGARLFVADRDRHAIEAFAFDERGGLHAIASTPATVAESGMLIVDRGDRYLYASRMEAGVVDGWAIGDDGSLTPVPGSPFTAGPRVASMVVTASGAPRQAAALPAPDAFDDAGAASPIDHTASLETLTAALEERSDATRLRAITALNGSGHDLTPALPLILRALDDPHPRVRDVARHIVGPYALTHPNAVDDGVLDRLVSGPDGRGVILDNASLTALHALKRRGATAATPLARALVNGGQLREEAAEALAGLGPAAAPAVPELRRLLTHPTAQRHAADALGAIGPAAAEAVPDLYELAGHRARPVAAAARRAIERIRRQP